MESTDFYGDTFIVLALESRQYAGAYDLYAEDGNGAIFLGVWFGLLDNESLLLERCRAITGFTNKNNVVIWKYKLS